MLWLSVVFKLQAIDRLRCSFWYRARKAASRRTSVDGESETCLPRPARCFLSDRKSLIQLQMGAAWSSCRARMKMFKEQLNPQQVTWHKFLQSHDIEVQCNINTTSTDMFALCKQTPESRRAQWQTWDGTVGCLFCSRCIFSSVYQNIRQEDDPKGPLFRGAVHKQMFTEVNKLRQHFLYNNVRKQLLELILWTVVCVWFFTDYFCILALC